MTKNRNTGKHLWMCLIGGLGALAAQPEHAQALGYHSYGGSLVYLSDSAFQSYPFPGTVRASRFFALPTAFNDFSTAALAVGDLSGDGTPEIVAGQSNGAGPVAIYEADGNRGLREQQRLPLAVPPHSAGMGDFTSDGVKDVAIGAFGGIYLYVRDGQSFAPPVLASNALNGEPLNAITMEVGDLNQDGRPDLVTLNEDQGQTTRALLTYLQQPAGGLGAAYATLSNGDLPARMQSIALGDLNGDAIPDLALSGEQSDGQCVVGVALSNGAGGFSSWRSIANGTANFRCGGIAIGNLRGDARNELLAGTYTQQNYPLPFLQKYEIRVFSVDVNGTVTAQETVGEMSNRIPEAFVIGDITGDGYADVIARNAFDVQAFEQVPSGQFRHPVTISGLSSLVRNDDALELADIDGDQRLDLIATGYSHTYALNAFSDPGATPVPEPPLATTYLPLHDGAEWSYFNESTNVSSTFSVQPVFTNIGGVSAKGLRDSDGVINYYTQSSLGLALHGARDTDGTVLSFDRPLRILDTDPAPGDSANTTGNVTVTLPDLSRYTLSFQFTSQVEGRELVRTPAGHFDALRVRTSLSISGSIEGEPISLSDTGVDWMARGLGIVKTRESDGTEVLLDYAWTDPDGDGLQTPSDLCPFNYDPANGDTDLDKIGDACDTDLDGDVLPNAWEIEHHLDPFQPLGIDGADGDYDRDGVSNLREYQKGTNPEDATSFPPALVVPALALGRGAGGGGLHEISAPHAPFVSTAALTLDTASNPALANYAAQRGETRPVWCNVDNDPAQELVVGLGRGGQGYVELKDDAAHGYQHLRWLRPSVSWAYYAANGETHPACGDIDGDGRDELVIGFGTGGQGQYALFDDALAQFAPLAANQNVHLRKIGWASYSDTGSGAVHPTVANLDADPRDEIVLGLGPQSQGWLLALDDAVAGFAPLKLFGAESPWLKLRYERSAGAAADGSTWPIVCDLDGDLNNEIVVGLDTAGQLLLYVADQRRGFGPAYKYGPQGWYGAKGNSLLPNADGAVHPTCGDVDGDGRDELIVGFGQGGEGRINRFRMRRGELAFDVSGQLDDSVYNAANGTVWPAIGGEMLPDTDGDGAPDIADDFPADPNEYRDTDDDGIGDNADLDDDNDTLPDDYENANGLDPRNAQGNQGGSGDIDGDGVSNAEERAAGTNLRNRDSDGDDLADGFEINRSLDPRSADSPNGRDHDPDNDGAGNWREQQAGTDPRNANSTPPPLPIPMIALGRRDSLVEIYPVSGPYRLTFVNLRTAPPPVLSGAVPAGLDTRPTWCDVDGDGLQELLVGLGRGGQGYVEIRDDAAHGFASLHWLRPPGNWVYYGNNGETFPACGDLDNDGRAEIVVGFGEGSQGWFMIFDDAQHGYAPIPGANNSPWRQLKWSSYTNSGEGALHPAVGNVDGDQAAELLLGLGRGGAGWIQVLDDAARSFAPLPVVQGASWFQTPILEHVRDGATWPTLCPVHGNERKVIAVATGPGLGARVSLIDVDNGYRSIADPINAANYYAGNLSPGLPQQAFDMTSVEGRVACGDIDRDGRAEIAMIAKNVGGNHWFEMHQDAKALYEVMGNSGPPPQYTFTERFGTVAIGGEVPVDTDSDGVYDVLDAFPNDANESRDNDSDGVGDNADTDDDADGLPDTYEVEKGLDPLVGSGAEGGGGDPDGDGLTNTEEHTLGTHPKLGDTDSDLLPDGFEVRYAFNPLVADADGDADNDGASNVEEARGGSDPRDGSSLPAVGPRLALGNGGSGDGGLDVQSAATGGQGERVRLSAHAELSGYIGQGGETRPVWCDVDGDGKDELVLGLGRGGKGLLEVKDDKSTGYAHLRWLRAGSWSYYGTNGESYPACGDVDGDGRDELVVGYGPGSAGWFYVFDDAQANYGAVGKGWYQRVWNGYNQANGELHLAVGNLDGDVRDELVVTGGNGNGGWVQWLDDAVTGFGAMVGVASWTQLPWSSYNGANGTVWPGVCDLNGDNKREVVLGLGSGSGGWLYVMDGATGYKAAAFTGQGGGWIRGSDAGYNALNGTLRPVCGQGDSDGADELYLGYGSSGAGKVEVRDDALHGLSVLGIRQGSNATGASAAQGVWPAVSR